MSMYLKALMQQQVEQLTLVNAVTPAVYTKADGTKCINVQMVLSTTNQNLADGNM